MSTAPGFLLFLVEGSLPIGTGHLRRCATLARHRVSSGWQVHFQVLGETAQRLPEEALLDILRDLSWQATDRPLPCPANVVIVDATSAWQEAAVAWCRDLHLPCLALDYQQPSLLPDAAVSLRDLSGQMEAAFAKAGRSHAYHEGVAYTIMRPSLVAQRALCLPPGQNGVLDVLVTLGGADPHGMTLEAIDLLRPWRNRLDHVTIVLGPGVGPELQQQVTHQARQLHFQVVKAPPDFDNLMCAADLVLCNGGGTLLESLFLGRLVAVLPQTEAESAFATPFCQQQACVWAREIVQIIETTEQERLEFARYAGSIVDGNGLDRIASVIDGLAIPPPRP